MNRCIIIGNLTKDVELRTTQSGLATCAFTVAVSRRFKNAQGERESDFIPVVAWRQTAELCAKYLAKGRKVAVEGSIQTRSYQAQDGSKRYVTELIADSVEFLTPRDDTVPGSQPLSGQQMDMRASMAEQGFTEVDDDELPF